MNRARETLALLIACGGIGAYLFTGPGHAGTPQPAEVPPAPGAAQVRAGGDTRVDTPGAPPAAVVAPPAAVVAQPAVALQPAAPVTCGDGPAPSAAAAARGDAKARQAAHRGMDYLAKTSRAWTDSHNCFGCHVQAVTLEALSAGQHHQYDVARADLDAMVRALRLGVTAGGRVTGAAFQGAAWARYDRWVDGAHTTELSKWAAELVELQAASGAVIDDDARRPITGGTMQTTYQAAQTWRQAHARTADEKWLRPLRRAEAFLASTAAAWKDSGEGADLQDLDFALLGLAASGAGRTDPSVARLHRMLIAKQRADGGWSLDPGQPSDAFATGQAVYALKMSGYGDGEAPVVRGLAYLLAHQDKSGSWRTYRSGQHGADKGETMWAVLGLVTVDVASIEVAGLVDGQHVDGAPRVTAKASDNGGGGIAKLELSVDDVVVRASCGGALEYALPAAALAQGMHVVEVVATNAKGQKSRRRFEVYAGDVQLTHVAADFDEVASQAVVTLRNIAHEAKGAVAFEVWSATEGADPKPAHKVYGAEQAATAGPMSFTWSGRGDDGEQRPRGRYYAKVTYRDAKGAPRQSETVLFMHDSASAQRDQFAEVEGKLSLDQGQRAASNTIVELVDDNGRVVQTTRTTDQGNYRFKNVTEGGYKVRTRKGGFTALESDVAAKRGASSAASMSW